MKICFLVINYNGIYFLNKYLKNISVLCLRNEIELIVTDDQSSDNSINYLIDSQVNYTINNSLRHGFASNVNNGIKYAKDISDFDYFIIANNDIELREEFLEKVQELLNFLKLKDSFFGILGFDEIDLSRIDYFNEYNFANFSLDSIKQVKEIPGFFFILSNELINNIGLFDEDYFMYGEDNDYFTRTLKANYTIYNSFLPIMHYSESSSTNDKVTSWFAYRNAFLYASKNLSIIKTFKLLFTFIYIIYNPFYKNRSASSLRVKRSGFIQNNYMLIKSILWNIKFFIKTKLKKMKVIETLNYKIEVKSQLAYNFLKICEIDFKGSTTIFYIIMKLFFRNSFTFILNGNSATWPIDTLSDFRLLRGDYDGRQKKYSLKLGYEGVDLMFVKKILKPGDIVLDLGANKGFYTLFFSSFVGLTGKVLSFEATNINFQTLIYRVKTLWNLINVLPFNFILGENNTTLVLMKKPNIFDDGTGFYFRKSEDKGIENSYTRKIDTLLKPLVLENIKLIKIDVEGAEYSVLSGALETLKLTEYILVEVSNTGVLRFGHSLENLYSLLESNDFLYSYTINLNKNNEVELYDSNRSAGNILFSKSKLI